MQPMIPLVALFSFYLPQAVAPSQSLDRATIAPAVEAALAENHIPGVVVAIVRDQELVLLEPFGLREVETITAMRADDLFQIGSCTKTFTAALLVQAAEKGELGLDDPLGAWLDGTRWVFGEICGFGGIFSSARDLARYLSALLAQKDAGPFTAQTRALLSTPVADAGPGQRMALGWFVQREAGGPEFLLHGGEVDSYSAMLMLQREARLGVVVLANRGADSAERVGRALLPKALSARAK